MIVADLTHREVLFTAHTEARDLALSEIEAVVPGTVHRGWLAPDVGWATLAGSWPDLVTRFTQRSPIFCRHICPAQVRVPIGQVTEDLDVLARATTPLAELLGPEPFSVQTRLLGNGWPYGPFDVNTRLAEVFAAGGAPVDVRRPVQVVSVALTRAEAFLGVSRAVDNLSDWAGGARRFRRDPDQISRAEFKLLEAIEIFGLDPPADGRVLDLGAAPGGWTRIMRSFGAAVVAVDPADLAPALARDPGVRHVRGLAQAYLPTARQQFAAIVNDMRMDARDSARLMGMAEQALDPTGWAVMTLKLPKEGTSQVLSAALAVLRRFYIVTGVRQLFHNRSEVTVAMRSRSAPRPASRG